MFFSSFLLLSGATNGPKRTAHDANRSERRKPVRPLCPVSYHTPSASRRVIYGVCVWPVFRGEDKNKPKNNQLGGGERKTQTVVFIFAIGSTTGVRNNNRWLPGSGNNTKTAPCGRVFRHTIKVVERQRGEVTCTLLTKRENWSLEQPAEDASGTTTRQH